MNLLNILIININNLKFTQELVNDLALQTCPYKLRLIDNCSFEPGTKEYFESEGNVLYPIEVIQNEKNVDINRLWNNFYLETDSDYLCFLNNDIRISSNFVKDTTEVLKREPTVGCVLHATNHPNYQKVTPLNYVILEDKITQGWAFSFRREAYKIIPDDIQFFGGDDFIFSYLYRCGWKTAMILSSPIIHFYARSRRYYTGDRRQNTENMLKYDWIRYTYRSCYTRRFPSEIMIERYLNGQT